jgi:hypothetical protein
MKAVRLLVFVNNQVTHMLTLDTTQQATVTAQAVDAKGRPTSLFSTPTWTESPAGIATLTPSADGLTCVIAGTTVGATTVTVSGDASPATGMQSVIGTLPVTVTAAIATSITVTPGPITPQP